MNCPNCFAVIHPVTGACNCVKHTTSTLDGKWPSDTWFRRALARQHQREAAELQAKAAEGRK